MLAALTALACAPAPRPRDAATPLGLDLYFPVPADNPSTAAKVALGRRLFFDSLLSADRTVACASCHRPAHAFSDSLARSRGAYGRVGPRSVPSLVNVAYATVLFWDGRETVLERQVVRPIQDTLEMALSLDDLLGRLKRERRYRARFASAFGDGVTAGNVARALASYLRTLRFGGEALDRFRAGDTAALAPEARAGFRLFIGRANCAACHIGPNLTDEGFHNTGVSWGRGDVGRFALTQDERDRGRFNTPSLRAVACTAPYLHDGTVATLEDVVGFYDRGGGPNPNLDPEVRPLGLSAAERRALVAFLGSLTVGGCVLSSQ